jgi:hypothetical protein
LKLNEIVALGCFALNPSHFKAVSIRQNSVFSTESGTRKKTELNPPLIDTSLIAPIVGRVASSPKIKCVTNEEFEAFARNIEEVGMASPLNVQYPGVDGVMHFRVKDEHNKEEWITAFLQVTISSSHAFSREAVGNLKAIIDQIEQTVKQKNIKNHRIVLFWLGAKTKNSTSPDINLNKNLNKDIHQYYVTKALDTPTATQKLTRKQTKANSAPTATGKVTRRKRAKEQNEDIDSS